MKKTFEMADEIDPSGISGMIAAYIHDTCLDSDTIKNPY